MDTCMASFQPLMMILHTCEGFGSPRGSFGTFFFGLDANMCLDVCDGVEYKCWPPSNHLVCCVHARDWGSQMGVPPPEVVDACVWRVLESRIRGLGTKTSISKALKLLFIADKHVKRSFKNLEIDVSMPRRLFPKIWSPLHMCVWKNEF